MTPKEKAIEIYYKFTTYAPLHNDNKKCALIAVNEILNLLPLANRNYWEEVRQEIEKL